MRSVPLRGERAGSSVVDTCESDPPATEAVKTLRHHQLLAAWYSISTWKLRQRPCDTTGFSRVVLQLQPRDVGNATPDPASRIRRSEVGGVSDNEPFFC
jgi:hypothetical protein